MKKKYSAQEAAIIIGTSYVNLRSWLVADRINKHGEKHLPGAFQKACCGKWYVPESAIKAKIEQIKQRKRKAVK